MESIAHSVGDCKNSFIREGSRRSLPFDFFLYYVMSSLIPMVVVGLDQQGQVTGVACFPRWPQASSTRSHRSPAPFPDCSSLQGAWVACQENVSEALICPQSPLCPTKTGQKTSAGAFLTSRHIWSGPFSALTQATNFKTTQWMD